MGTGEIIALALVKYGPSVARGIVEVFRKENITVADWEPIFALASTPYEAYTAPLTPPTQPS